jgi:hypothetical protein
MDKSLSAGITLSAEKLKDEGMSALIYKGVYPGMQVNYHVDKYNFKQSIMIGVAGGNLNNRNNGTSLSVKSFRINYTGLIPVITSRAFRFTAGGVFDNYLALRRHDQYINNRDFYEFNSSVGLAANLSYTFGNADNYGGSTFRLSSGLSIPILTAMSRSNAIDNRLSDFQSPTLKTYIKNIHWVSFEAYNSYSSLTELKLTAGRNALSLSYQWNYYHIKQDYQVHSVVGTIALNYYLTL